MEKQIIIHTDSEQLSGVLHIPDCSEHEKRPAILICHGFISSKVGQHRLFVTLARKLCHAGYIVLRFDFSGCGESSGEYRNITSTQQIKETMKAIDFLEKQPDIDISHIILLGHSLGGAIAASVAALDRRIHQLILLSPVANAHSDIVEIVGQERFQECLEEGVVNFEGFELGEALFLSLRQLQPLAEIHKFQGNVLLIHGSEDIETPLENVYQYQSVLAVRAACQCRLQIIAGADHTYNSPLWENELQQIIIEWLRQLGR